MSGYKEDSDLLGEGLYNLYCLGCTSSRSSQTSMLLHDWVSLDVILRNDITS